MWLDTTDTGEADSVYWEGCRFSNWYNGFNNNTGGGWLFTQNGVTANYGQSDLGGAENREWRFDGCYFGDRVYSINVAGSGWQFDNCRFDGAMTHGLMLYAIGDTIYVSNCVFEGASQTYSYRTYTFALKYNTGVFDNCRWYPSNDNYYGLGIAHYGAYLYLNSCLVAPKHRTRLRSFFSSQNTSHVFVSGGTFFYGYLLLRDYGSVQGATFRDSAYVHTSDGKIAVMSNYFYGPSAYGVNINSGDSTLVGGNTFRNNVAAGINDGGTHTITYDNHNLN